MNSTAQIPDSAMADALQKMSQQIIEAIQSGPQVTTNQRLVKKEWIAEYFGVGASTCERIIALYGFPRAIKVPGSALRWVQAEVIDWALEQRR